METVLNYPVDHKISGFDFVATDDYKRDIIISSIFESLASKEGNREFSALVLSTQNYIEGEPIEGESSSLSFTVNEDIRFSDGSYLTTHDVYRSIDRAIKEFPPRRSNQARMDSITVSPDGLLTLYSHNTYRNKFIFLSYVDILKAEYIDQGNEFVKNNPLGTGSYYVYSRTDEQIILKKNKYHRDYKMQKRYPDKVRIYYEPSIDKQFEQMKANKADFIENIPLHLYDEAFSSDNMYINVADSNIKIFLQLDTMSKTLPHLNSNPFSNKNVRHAIAHAIDLDRFIEEVLHGQATRLVIPDLPNQQGYPTDKEFYKYDLELSKKLMNEAGYPNGFDMKITVRNVEIVAALGKFIQDSLKDIKINVPLDLHYISVYDVPNTSALLSPVFVRYTRNVVNNLASLYFRSSTQRGGLNIYRYYNPTLTGLFEQAINLNLYYPGRQVISDQIVDFVYEEMAVIPMITPHSVYLINNRYLIRYSDDLSFADFMIKK
jgi:ABC-type transport system substrate-binding protein